MTHTLYMNMCLCLCAGQGSRVHEASTVRSVSAASTVPRLAHHSPMDQTQPGLLHSLREGTGPKSHSTLAEAGLQTQSLNMEKGLFLLQSPKVYRIGLDIWFSSFHSISHSMCVYNILYMCVCVCVTLTLCLRFPAPPSFF